MVSGMPLCDTWNVDETTGLRHCSWCGSIHPDQFMHLVRTHCVLTPTDKEYKVYVDETVARIVTGDTNEIVTPPHQRKFYFQHLGVADRVAFKELHNAGQLSIGYPGNCYVVPYFMVPPRSARPSEVQSSSVQNEVADPLTGLLRGETES